MIGAGNAGAGTVSTHDEELFREEHVSRVQWLIFIPVIVFFAFWEWGLIPQMSASPGFMKPFVLFMILSPLLALIPLFRSISNKSPVVVTVSWREIIIRTRAQEDEKRILLEQIDSCRILSEISPWDLMHKEEFQETLFVYRKGAALSIHTIHAKDPIIIGSRNPLGMARAIEEGLGRPVLESATPCEDRDITVPSRNSPFPASPVLYRSRKVTWKGILAQLLTLLVAGGICAGLLVWGITSSGSGIVQKTIAALLLLLVLYGIGYSFLRSIQTICLQRNGLTLAFGPIPRRRFIPLDGAVAVERVDVERTTHTGHWQKTPGGLIMHFNNTGRGVRIAFSTGYTLTIATHDIRGLEQALKQRIQGRA